MLTRRQHDLLLFIDQFQKKHQWSPSYDEMVPAIGLASKSGVNRLVVALINRGYLSKRKNLARSLQVLRLPGEPARDVAEALRALLEALDRNDSPAVRAAVTRAKAVLATER